MYVIRRHSRKLFFPAGLLALAWLPVLGGALLAARPELRKFRERVMQLSLPTVQRHFMEVDGKRISLFLEEQYASPAQLDTMHPWHTVRFTGNPWQDDISARTATFVAQQLKTEPNHDRGLRIQFEPHSQYRSLVAMLDMFQVVGLQKYWIDTRYESTTLYSFTVPPKPTVEDKRPAALVFICGTPFATIDISSPEPEPSWIDRLISPDWRYSTFLLLLLPLAAVWQLRRLRPTDFRR